MPEQIKELETERSQMSRHVLHVFYPLLLFIQLIKDDAGKVAARLVNEELLRLLDVLCPVIFGHAEQLLLVDPVQSLGTDRPRLGQKPDWARLGNVLVVDSSTDPVDDSHVLAEARPQELALLVQAEPVDVEDLGHVSPGLVHVQPVLQVVTEVVAEEWPHRHRVVHDLLACTHGGQGVTYKFSKSIYSICTTSAKW